MGIRAGIVGLAAAGMLVVAPILMAQQPAGAAVYQSQNATQVDFGDYQDLLVDCTIQIYATHDTTAETLNVESGIVESNSECDSFIAVISVDYDDAHGDAQHVEAGATSTGSVFAKGVVSHVKVTDAVTFIECNRDTNATCTFTTVTAPK